MRLQPETADFQRDAADSMEDVLVAAISKRTALSEGDWLDVDVLSTSYRLHVQQLKPKPQVSVVGEISLPHSYRWLTCPKCFPL